MSVQNGVIIQVFVFFVVCLTVEELHLRVQLKVHAFRKESAFLTLPTVRSGEVWGSLHVVYVVVRSPFAPPLNSLFGLCVSSTHFVHSN